MSYFQTKKGTVLTLTNIDVAIFNGLLVCNCIIDRVKTAPACIGQNKTKNQIKTGGGIM